MSGSVELQKWLDGDLDIELVIKIMRRLDEKLVNFLHI